MLDFLKKENGTIFFVFNIASNSVSGALVKIDNGKKPQVLYSTRTDIKNDQTDKKSETILRNSLSALKKIADKMARDGSKHLNFTGARVLTKKYICFLGAPWSYAESKEIKYEKKNMFFSKALLESLIGKEEEDFGKVAVSKFMRTTNSETRVIEKRSLNIRLNGYRAQSPYDKKADSAEMTIYLGMAPQKACQAFEAAINNAFHTDQKVKFHTFILAAAETLSKYDKDPFALLDITGDVTEVAIIKNGAVSEILNIPLSTNGLAMKLANKFATTKSEAFSMLRMYADKILSKPLEEGIQKEIEDYGSDLIYTIQSISNLPESWKLYFVSEPEMMPIIKEWGLKNIKNKVFYLDNSAFTNKFNGIAIDSFLNMEISFMEERYNLQS